MENKEKLFEYLKSRNFMSLATFGEKISVCGVFYAIDEDFNLYFISEISTEHSKNISFNNSVACAIADSNQKVSDKKIGVQIKGEASELKNLTEIGKAILLWNKANPGIESVISLDNLKTKLLDSRVYKITSTEIKFFNEELYGPEGTEIFKF